MSENTVQQQSQSPFDTPEALELNRARIEHLESLNLELQGKRVLDVGCGVGHFAKWFVGQGAVVTGIDARWQCLEAAHDRGLSRSFCFDIQQDGRRPHYMMGETFDIVFCYGLLYHLENPLRALRNMAALCDGILLLETIVCDHPAPLLMLRSENPSLENQGVSSLSTVPTMNFLVASLASMGVGWIYTPRVGAEPGHREFQWIEQNDLACEREGRSIRGVFAASRQELTFSNRQMMLVCRGSASERERMKSQPVSTAEGSANT